MKQKRGWIWLTSGILLAILAGLLTFQLVNELTANTKLTEPGSIPTVAVLVATQKIEAYTLIENGSVAVREIPANIVPEDYISAIEDATGKMTLELITPGQTILKHHLVDPTDPESPVLYHMDPDKVLIAIPAEALLGQVGLLTVGARIDIAYSSELTQLAASGSLDRNAARTTFLGLQNLEIKGLLRSKASKESPALFQPDAILLAVSPQDALVIKYLIDSGAPMDIFLRAPSNEALMPVAPVNQQFLIDYFQLKAEGTGKTANYTARNGLTVSRNQDAPDNQRETGSPGR
jgi:Flp pilus assembly protein CpaB